MGGPSIPGVGWAAGIDRLALMLKDDTLPPLSRPIVMIPMDESFDIKSLSLAQTLREQGHVVEMTYGGNLGKRLKKANKINARFALIIGETEVASHSVTLKDLDTGEQIQLPQEQINKAIKDKGVS